MKVYDEHAAWIDQHLSKFFKEDEISVYHEIVSLDVHLDVYYINSPDNDFNILLTSGMSTLEMSVEAEVENRDDLKFAELMMLLPKEIQFDNIHTGNEKNAWIISMLKQTARFPHDYNTWIGVGHTLQADADMKPYDEETLFVGTLILPSMTYDDDFTEINREGRKINFYNIFPLYQNELVYKIENGYDDFIEQLISASPSEIFNNNRENILS